MPTTPTAEPLVPPEPSPTAPMTPAVPTLDEIAQLEPGERRAFRNVDWDFYLRVHDVVGECPSLRIAFEGKDLEIMPVSPLPEADAWFGGALVEVIAQELRIPWMPLGSTTRKSPAARRGVEADESFYLTAEKVAAAVVARARRSVEADDYPIPDLAIEVDISPPKVDRPSIYAALQVQEIWRFGDRSVIIERLSDQGNYVCADANRFLRIRAEEVVRWVFEEVSSDVAEWQERLRAWVRAELSNR
jgi:Uma2 family endonuclease